MPVQRPVWSHSLSAALWLMAPFDILASLAMDIYLPVVPEMPRVLGTTPAVIQLTLSAYMVLLGVGQLLFGPLADRLGRRPVLLAGGTLFAVASLGLAASSTAAPFIACRVLQALGASAMLVATFATVRDVYAHREEGTTIYAMFGAALAFVPALGPILGALLESSWGWRAIFIALAVLAALAVANAVRGWQETRVRRTSVSRSPMGQVLRSLRFWTYTLGFSAAMGTFFVFFSTAPRVLIERAGFAPLAFSLVFGTVAVVMMVATRGVRRAVLRWGEAGCLARGMGLLLVGAALLMAGLWLGRPSFVTFIVPMWVSAVGMVATVAVTANGALKHADDAAGTAVAAYFCAQSVLVGAVGTAVVLVLPGDTAWPLVAFSAGMAVVVMVALAALQRREQAAS